MVYIYVSKYGYRQKTEIIVLSFKTGFEYDTASERRIYCYYLRAAGGSVQSKDGGGGGLGRGQAITLVAAGAVRYSSV